jgi:methylenetetrahydrofolate dehydrogenase (NADP+)/methenyltetrahydrofolate cyclohydrolase
MEESMAVIMDGNRISRDIRNQVKSDALRLKETRGIVPGLAVILVGEDAASKIYLKRKENACKEAGFISREYRLLQGAQENEVFRIIDELNHDNGIHGILVQLPLPQHLNALALLELIDPRKDVDGFHPWNMGRLITGNPYHIACTPRGVLEMIDRHGIEIEGKEAVIVGRSNIVGKPLALLLLNRHATVTICHTRTRQLTEVTKRADILVVAIGQPEMIKKNMVKDGAVVVDVGINRLDGGRLVGDVAFREVAEKASYITPVPGGVGPMTIAMLLVNTLKAASGQILK